MSAFLSLHLAQNKQNKKKLKVERLGSKQLSPDDNKDEQKKRAGPDENDSSKDLLRENNNSHRGSTCVKQSKLNEK